MMGAIFVLAWHHCPSVAQPQHTCVRPTCGCLYVYGHIPSLHGSWGSIPAALRQKPPFLLCLPSRCPAEGMPWARYFVGWQTNALPSCCAPNPMACEYKTHQNRALPFHRRLLFLWQSLSHESRATTKASLFFSCWSWIKMEFLLATKLEDALLYMLQNAFEDWKDSKATCWCATIKSCTFFKRVPRDNSTNQKTNIRPLRWNNNNMFMTLEGAVNILAWNVALWCHLKSN